MDLLEMLQLIADLQFRNNGAVGIKEIQHHTNTSRQAVHVALKKLIMRNYVTKNGHNKYVLKSDDNLVRLGLLVVLPMDVYEFSSRRIINNG